MQLSLIEFRPRARWISGLAAVVVATGLLIWNWDDLFEKRVAIVVPNRVIRGAWQRPGPLRTILGREKIKTIVTLTAINDDDPKFVDQKRVVDDTGVRWIRVPMRGSKATLDQMAEAADLLADPLLQPVFFHCVAGHHRTSLTHAAYRIRHEGWSASRAWNEVSSLAWARPSADHDDRRSIEAFAASEFATRRTGRDRDHEVRPTAKVDPPSLPRDSARGLDDRGMEPRDSQLRDRGRRPDLSVGTNARLGPGQDGS